MLRKLKITNLGPIAADEISLDGFAYFVGRNNAGKSHYLRAVELLLAQKNPTADEIQKLQHDPNLPIEIEGVFDDVEPYLPLLTKSNHKDAVSAAMTDGCLTLVRRLDPVNESLTGIRIPDQPEPSNPCGNLSTLLQVFPDTISIIATADTVEELKTKGSTAIEKLKKEVMAAFFSDLRAQTEMALTGLDAFLHSAEDGVRSPALVAFESDLQAEFTGEFCDVKPTVRFVLPTEDVIAKEMQILLDDGHESEVEQKGHGLQRATLLALLKLLAKKGQRYQVRPAPIFLIGELETFLHPFAQKLLADSLTELVTHYQVLTTTHSPFIISPEHLQSYFRVRKNNGGTTATGADWSSLDQDAVRRHLSWRHNLEALFGDRVILVEGQNDEGFYERARQLFDIPYPPGKWTVIVRTAGKKHLTAVREFYSAMGFDDVTLVADLDYLFCRNGKQLLAALGMDENRVDTLRSQIGWAKETDPKIQEVLAAVDTENPTEELRSLISDLREHRVFVLQHGTPENYCTGLGTGRTAWIGLESIDQLNHADFLRDLVSEVVSPESASGANDQDTVLN